MGEILSIIYQWNVKSTGHKMGCGLQDCNIRPFLYDKVHVHVYKHTCTCTHLTCLFIYLKLFIYKLTHLCFMRFRLFFVAVDHSVDVLVDRAVDVRHVRLDSTVVRVRRVDVLRLVLKTTNINM